MEEGELAEDEDTQQTLPQTSSSPSSHPPTSTSTSLPSTRYYISDDDVIMIERAQACSIDAYTHFCCDNNVICLSCVCTFQCTQVSIALCV